MNTNSEHDVKYVIISPVKNEERYIAQTIESVIHQTIKPSLWIIVDDSSTDNTRGIIERYSAEHDFIRLVTRQSGPHRDIGYGGIRAFNFAMKIINACDYDYIVNLDGDVLFGPDYFARLFKKFNQIPKLGIAGGRNWLQQFGRLVPEKTPETHVSGYTKVYRKECFLDLEPIREVPSWDTIDELQAQRLGWLTLNFKDIQIMHLKPMALGSGNIIKGKFVQGRVSYRIGYPLDFMIFRSIKMLGEPPYILGGILAFTGFLTSLLLNERILIEEDLVKYLRRTQRTRIYRFFT